MSFQASSLRVAGQESDVVDVPPPSNISRSLLDARLSPTSGRLMYRNSESIKSWIETVDGVNNPGFKFDDSDGAHVFEFATHPFRIYYPCSPFSDRLESKSDILFPLDASTWAPNVFASSCYDDSDESRSESSASDDAQYITIPSDSPWYCPPSPSPGPISAHELGTAAYVNSCSSDVRQVIAQQELLLAIFHQELCRILPHDDGAGSGSDWLEDVDADLLLEPLETYTDLCWKSVVCESSPISLLDRPIPDVPTGFDEGHGAY